MRSFFAAALFAMLSLNFCGVYAAEKTAQTPEGVSEQDKARLKDQLKELGKAFGVEVPAPKDATSPANPPEKKTVADVADKALDMVANVTAQLSGMLSKMAPKVWEIMIRQQYAKAAMNTIVPFGLLGVLLIYYFGANRVVSKIKGTKSETFENTWLKRDSENSDDFWLRMWVTKIIPLILLFLTSLLLFNRISDSVALLINPEYYAIQDLLRLLLAPGSGM